MTPNQNQEQKNWFYFIGFVLSRNSLEETVYDLNTFKPVEDPGEKSGSFAPPPSPLGRGEQKILRPPPAPSESSDPPMQTLTESVYLLRNVKSFIFGRQTNIFIWSIFSKTAKVNPPWFMRPRTFFFKVPKEKIIKRKMWNF